MESLRIKVNSKERYDFEDFSGDFTLQSARVSAREYLQSMGISGTGSLEVGNGENSFIFQFHCLEDGEILLVIINQLDGPLYLDEASDDWIDVEEEIDYPDEPDSEEIDYPDEPDSDEIDYPDEPDSEEIDDYLCELTRRSPTGNDPYYARYDLGYASMSDFDLDIEETGYEPDGSSSVSIFQDLANMGMIDRSLHHGNFPWSTGSVMVTDPWSTITTGSITAIPVGNGRVALRFSPFLMSSNITEDRVQNLTVHDKSKPKKQKLQKFERRKPNLKQKNQPKNFRRVNQPRSHKQKHTRKR
jgi:hypothetical protein